MDSYGDIFEDQIFQFSPICFPSSPESFTSLMEFLQGPIMVETETVNEDHVGLIANPVISEDNRSTSTQQLDLVPLPETLTILQNPPELQQEQQLLSNSSGFLQGNLPNIQSDQQCLSNQNMNYLQEPNVSTMQQEELLCNPHGYSQANLPNGQPNQNMLNSFQQPNVSTMIGTGQQVEGENIGYAPTTMIRSFELPDNPQEQCLSIPLLQSYPPTYQHDPFASPFNMYDHQPPPVVLAEGEDEPLVPRMATNLARTYPLKNQTSMTPPLPQMLPSSTRTYSLQNQTSMTPPLLQMPPSSTRHHGQRLVNQPSPSFRYPHLDTYTQIPPSTNAFTTSLQGPFASPFNMYDQQMSPLALADERDAPLVPSMVTNLARKYPLQMQISMTPLLPQIPSSSTRTYPLQNQISMTPPLPQMSSSSTRHHGNVQELVNQPSSSRYPQLNTDTQIRPTTNSITPLQSSLGRRQRSYQSHFEHGESSSSAQRRRIVLPERNVDSVAENPVQERLRNKVYSPHYESLGLYTDPHLRRFYSQE